jgi:hypothetical protein
METNFDYFSLEDTTIVGRYGFGKPDLTEGMKNIIKAERELNHLYRKY